MPVNGKKAELIERLKGEAEETPNRESEEVDYEGMTVPLLKEALKEHGLPVNGKKAELIERLKGGSK